MTKGILPKGIIKNYNVIIKGELLWPTNWFWCRRYKEIRTLTAGWGEDYATGCLLDYDYIKNLYRLIAVSLSRQKQLDVNPKAIQQIQFVGQLKKLDINSNVTDAGDAQSVSVLTILKKLKKRG